MSTFYRNAILGSLLAASLLTGSLLALPPRPRPPVFPPNFTRGPFVVQQPYFIPPATIQVPPPPWPTYGQQFPFVSRLPASAYTLAPLGPSTFSGNPYMNNPYRFYLSGLYFSQLNQFAPNYPFSTPLNNPYMNPYLNPLANPYANPSYNNYSNPYTIPYPGTINPASNVGGYGVAGAGANYAGNSGNAYAAPSAPSYAAKTNGAGQKSILTTFGVPTENGEVNWPLAIRLMPQEQKSSLDKLESLLHVAATQATSGRINPRTQEEATQALEKVRDWLQAHQLDMAEGTYRDGQSFLQQLGKSLKTMGNS